VISRSPSALAANLKLQRPAEFEWVVLSILVALLWALRHQYAGITSDAQLYAFQALARLHPALATDLSLQNTSQDDYTLFTPFYAAVIAVLDVRPAALALWIPCKLGFLIAAWCTVRALSSRETALVSVALLAATIGSYGAATVFRYDEDYFTARSVAEALVLFALACHLRGRRLLGFGLAIGALTLHPLMALPGLLLLLCLTVSTRLAVAGAFGGVAATLVFACAPLVRPELGRFITVMDPAWLAIVRERSQFLFLQLWSVADWELNVRPFLALTVSYAVVTDPLVRRVSVAGMLVGGAGLCVALIASSVGPVAILLQGQAWRWVWLTGLLAVLLVVPTGKRLWQDERWGPVYLVLWLSAWCFGGALAIACLGGLAALWFSRSRLAAFLPGLHRAWLHWAAAGGVAAILLWTIQQARTIVALPLTVPSFGYPAMQKLRSVFELGVPSVLLILLVLWVLGGNRRAWAPVALGTCLGAALIGTLQSNFPQRSRIGMPAELREFDDWRATIPPTGTVYVPAFKDSGGFVWFTLERPAYLSTDQSAGVVFSRRTAMEIERRSEVLLPVEDPDWEIMTHLAKARGNHGKAATGSRPLTARSLAEICRDPVLGFVAAVQNVGFDPIQHASRGTWSGWNLYDCERVRVASGRP
jgi:hypothetical protein